MSPKLYVDLTTRGRVWLEARAIPLPDPWAPEDIPRLIEQHYPGGRYKFVWDIAPEAAGKAHQAQVEAATLARRAETARERRARNPHKHRAAAKRYYETHKRAILQLKHEQQKKEAA